MPEAKILIVEDEAIAAMDIQHRLAALGYPLPDIAYNGEEGVSKAEKTQPDLVLMDIMMPGKLDGIAAAEQIRSRFDIPIIFLTAYSDEKTLTRAKITAPYGYIVKPFQERELHIAVDMALYRHKMERELREREKWLATTLRSIGDAVVATDEKGLITFMNPVAEALTGYKAEEALQKNLTEVFNIINRDTRKPVEDPVARVILEGNIVGLANHTVLISRDGKEIPINDSAAPIKDDHGNILGVILVFSDVSEHEKFEEALGKAYDEMQAANAALLNSRRAALNLMEDALAARKLAEDANVELLHEVTERKRAEEALRESEEQFRTLADSIPNLAWWANGDGYITWYNQRWYDYTGTTPEQMEGWGWQSVHDPEALPNVLERWKTSLDTGEPFDMEFPLRGGDGIFRTFLTRVMPLKDSAGQVIRWFGTNTDVSRLKRTEEALKESEVRVRLKLESILSPEGNLEVLELADIIDANSIQSLMEDFYEFAHIPMAIIDLKGAVLVGVGWQEICTKFHRVNPETCKGCIESDVQLSSGVSAGKFKLYKCKNSMWDVATPIIVGDKHVGNLFTGQFFFADEPLDYGLFRSQARKYGFDEKEYIAALEAVPRLSRESLDTTMSFFMKFSDIISKSSYSNLKLARSLAERDALMGSLSESEERFRILTENSPDCIALHDTELRHIYVNPAVSELIGLPLEAFVGKTVWEMGMPSEAASQLDSLLRQVLETGQKYSGELIFPAPGGMRFFNWRSVPILSADGTIRAVLAIAGDITVLKQTEAALLESAEDLVVQNVKLEDVNRELEAFIYSVSHDLRAPLRTMSGFAKILVEDYTGQLDEQGRDYLARISKGSAKMSRLIEDLLDLSKISKQELRIMEIDLSELASNIASGLREANPERNVDISIEEGLKARVDKTLMEIVLSNLIGNAWKFTSKTDNARIEFGSLEGTVPDLRTERSEVVESGLSPAIRTVYFVRDNGAGFDPTYKDKMFGPFQRLHSEKEFPGTGIGLTIVERIIRRHGGKVWAEGGAGEGAVIYFTLG